MRHYADAVSMHLKGGMSVGANLLSIYHLNNQGGLKRGRSEKEKEQKKVRCGIQIL